MGELTEIATSRVPSPNPPSDSGASPRRTRHHLAEMLIDAALILIGFAIAYWMRYLVSWPPPFEQVVREVAAENFVPIFAFAPIALPLVAVLLVLFAMRGLYRLPPMAGLLDHASIIVSSVTTGIALLIVVVFIARPFFYSRLIFAFAWVVIIVLLCSWRLIWIGFRRWQWARGRNRVRVLVVGGRGMGRRVMERVVTHPFMGYALVGYLEDLIPPANNRRNMHFRHLGRIDDLEALLRASGVDQVLIALPFWEQHRLPSLVTLCRKAGIDFRVVPDLYHLSFNQVDVSYLSGVPLIGIEEVRLKGGNLALKRLIDLLLVVVSAPLVLPLAALISLAIRLDSPGPVIFAQQRVGKDGRLFTCYKFRTMVADAEARKAELERMNEADGPLFKMRDDPRMTRTGRVLRRLSLDELPQLWNVVRGEMSWVGPRPPTPAEVASYEEWHRRRLSGVPGLTGLWQVLGRSDTSFDEMVRLDIYYIENWSLGMDLRILLQTLPAVLSGRGAY